MKKTELILFVEKQGFWICVLVAILLYSATINHGFVYDDEIVIIKNTHVQNGLSGLSSVWTTNYLNGVQGYNDGLFRPLSPTVFAFITEWFGNNPTPFHVINILIYALIGGVSYLFFCLLFSSTLVGMAVSILFMAHPIHTEVVANIKSLDELLSGLFGLLTLYVVVRQKEISVKSLLLTSLCFLLALFSKESSVSLVLVIPLLYWFFHKQLSKSFWILTGLLVIIAFGWYRHHTHVIESMSSAIDEGLFSGLSNAVLLADTRLDMLSTGIWITFTYLYKCVLPISLSSDYSPNAIPMIPFLSVKSFIATVSLVVFFVLGSVGLRKNQLYGIGAFIFFSMIAPVSNIFIQIGTSFGERLAFMPSLGIVICAGWLIGKIPNKTRIPSVIFVILIFSIATVSRSRDWKSNLSLYAKDVEKQPDSFRTHYNFATALNASVGEKTNEQLTYNDRKNILTAIEHYHATIKIKPLYLDVYNNLGNAYRRLGDMEKAIETHKKLVQMDSSYTKGLFNLAVTYYEIKNYKDAHNYFMKYSLTSGSEKAAALYHAGICSGYLGDFKSGIQEFDASLRLDPSKYDAWNFMGMAYGNLQQWDNAIVAFERAYALNKSETVLNNLETARKHK